MRALAILLAAGSLGLGASLLAACGERNDLIAASNAGALNRALDAVDSAVADGNCRAADRAASALRDEVAGLPLTVNARVRRNLAQGASTVSELAATDCRTKPPTTTTDTTPTTTTPTTTTTDTTPTTTTPTTTTDTTTTTTGTTTTTTTAPTQPNGGGGAPSGGGAAPGGANSQ